MTARNYNLNANDWQEKSLVSQAAERALLSGREHRRPGAVARREPRPCESSFSSRPSKLPSSMWTRACARLPYPPIAGSPGYTGKGMANGDFTDSNI